MYQNLYNSWVIANFNVFFTALPIIAYGSFEQDVSAETSLQYPQLYKDGQKDKFYNQKNLLIYQLNGIWGSIVVFFGSYLAFKDSIIDENGQATGIWVLGIIAMGTLVWGVNWKIAIDTRYWTAISIIIWVLTTFNWYPFVYILSNWQSFDPSFFGEANNSIPTGVYWTAVILLAILMVLPEFIYLVFQRTFKPENYQIVQELEYTERKSLKKEKKRLKRTVTQFVRNLAKSPTPKHEDYRGYAFSQDEKPTEKALSRIQFSVFKKKRKNKQKEQENQIEQNQQASQQTEYVE